MNIVLYVTYKKDLFAFQQLTGFKYKIMNSDAIQIIPCNAYVGNSVMFGICHLILNYPLPVLMKVALSA
jgi:hypothetical protein